MEPELVSMMDDGPDDPLTMWVAWKKYAIVR
jgi:hypothetical protein